MGRRKARQRVVDGTVTISRGAIEQRKAALVQQSQGLQRRLAEIEQQGRQLQEQRGQVIADLNAVSGALQLCDELLKVAPAADKPASLDADTVESAPQAVAEHED